MVTQQQREQLDQKNLVDLDLQRSLDPALRQLLALDDAANDQLAQLEVKRSGFLE